MRTGHTVKILIAAVLAVVGTALPSAPATAAPTKLPVTYNFFDGIRAELPSTKIAIFDLGLFCLLEHLPFRNPIDLSSMPRLTAFAAAFAARPSAQATPYRFDAPPPEAATQR